MVSEAAEGQVSGLKETGNAHFNKGDYKAALEVYNRALKCEPTTTDGALLATIYKNRAAVHLKMTDYAAAERDATKALEFAPNDPKALFRRCQAREQLGSLGDAFKDAKTALHYEPQNKALMTCLQRLVEANQIKQKEAASTENRVKQMLQYAFTKSDDSEKRVQAMNNLVVLAREPVGADLIWHSGILPQLLEVIEAPDEDSTVVLAAQRVLDELAKSEQRCLWMLSSEVLGDRKLVRILNSPRGDREIVDAAMLLVQRCFNALSGMDRREEIKPDKEKCEKNKMTLVHLIMELEDMLVDPGVSAVARDAVIDLLMKNLMHMDGGLPRGWSWNFVENGLKIDRGIWQLLIVSTQIPEQGWLPVSPETREHMAICLTCLYDDMVFDTKRSWYKDVCEKFLNEKLPKISDPTVQVEICAYITTLLMGPFDLGFTLIGNSDVTAMMLQMAASDNEIHQSVAAELIVHSAGKRDRCSAIIAQGVPILKQLFESKNPAIKARALVGLCKCASSGGSDASIKPMAEGSTLKLAQACKKILLSAANDVDSRRWAAEGLSYLTLDADVKESVVEDNTLVRALVTLAKQAGSMCVYGVASIFVNLTNSYDAPKTDDKYQEMKKLAQFAKHHVPEEHPKDAKEFVDKRVDLLVKEGATSACVAIGSTESHQSRELLARALCKFTDDEKHRGQVVQEGGAKLLVKLALEGTEDGKTWAAQSLARIGLSMNPSIAFPGQRMYEIVRPLISLLDQEKDGRQNYEALLSLTNLASISDSLRRRIWKEKPLPKIEDYWYMTDHDDLRAAACELLLNIIHLEDAYKAMIDPRSERYKLWVLYSADEDDRLAKAASGGLSIITQDKDTCIRISTEIKSWIEVLKDICLQVDPETQHRGLLSVFGMLKADEAVAAKIIQSEIFEVVVAISKMEDPERKKSRELASEALKLVEEMGLIRATDRELFERHHQVSTIKEE